MFRTKVFLGAAALVAAIGFWSCQSPLQGQKVSGFSEAKSLTYRNLQTKAYMGGSVLYNPADPTTGQVQKNAHIAYRLGKVTKTVDEQNWATFKDIPEQALYGEISVAAVDSSSISFVYTQYDAQGTYLGLKEASLSVGQELDLTNDALPDLRYVVPTKTRPGFEKALYLEFVSSTQLLNTSMFCLIAESYGDHELPNGLLGINPSGDFIATKYKSDGQQRSIHRGISTGDYFLDTDTGRYRKVAQSSDARSLDSNDLGETVTQDEMVQVLPLVNFEISGNVNDVYSEPALDSRAVTSGEYDQQKARLDSIYKKYFTFFNYDLKNNNTFLKDNFGLVFTSPASVKFGIWGTGNMSWSSVDAKIEIVAYISAGKITFNYERSHTSVKGMPVVKDYVTNSPVDLTPKFTIPIPGAPIVVGPVTIQVDGFCEGGIPLTMGIPNTLDLEVGFAGIYGGGVSMGANWGVDVNWNWWGPSFSPYFRTYGSPYGIAESAFFASAPKLNLSKSAYVSLSPNIYYGAKATLWGCVYGKFGPKQGVELRGDFSTSEASAKVNLFLNLEAEAGIMDRRLFGHTIPLINQTIANWRIY